MLTEHSGDLASLHLGLHSVHHHHHHHQVQDQVGALLCCSETDRVGLVPGMATPYYTTLHCHHHTATLKAEKALPWCRDWRLVVTVQPLHSTSTSTLTRSPDNTAPSHSSHCHNPYCFYPAQLWEIVKIINFRISREMYIF